VNKYGIRIPLFIGKGQRCTEPAGVGRLGKRFTGCPWSLIFKPCFRKSLNSKRSPQPGSRPIWNTQLVLSKSAISFQSFLHLRLSSSALSFFSRKCYNYVWKIWCLQTNKYYGEDGISLINWLIGPTCQFQQKLFIPFYVHQRDEPLRTFAWEATVRVTISTLPNPPLS